MADDFCTDDWPTTLATFQRKLGTRITRRRPRGLTGRNFVTDETLGYVLDANGDPAEISTGWMPATGRNGTACRIFGLTWGRSADGSPDPRDCAAWSWVEVLEKLCQQRPTDGGA